MSLHSLAPDPLNYTGFLGALGTGLRPQGYRAESSMNPLWSEGEIVVFAPCGAM